MRNPEKHFYDFGPFRFDPEKQRLLRDGNLVSLKPKAMDALLVLVQNKGKLLEREALMQAVWADSFVEDANLTVAISSLRKALGQNGETAEYIETIPRVGYRFVAEVKEVWETPAPLIVEKHTRSQTVIEEEFVEDASVHVGKVIAHPRNSGAVPLPVVFGQHRTAAFLTIIILVCVALGGVVYFKPGQRGAAEARNLRARSIRSLAVLPPKVLNAADDPSLSLSMADALITKLTGLRKITLRPTSSISRYVATNIDSVTVGRSLGVDAVLQGTLRSEGGRLRLTLQLIDVASGAEIWAGKFDESDSNISRLQDAVSQQMMDVLLLNLTLDEKTEFTKRQTQNPEAYALYLRGNYFWNKRGVESVKAAQYYRKAIELDPNYARAYVGLATVDACEHIPSPEAQAMVELALQLDNNLSEAHATYGFIKMFHYWDWEGAERELNRAIELDPNSVTAHHWKGVYLSIRSRLDEAKIEMHQALELDPLSIPVMADIGQLHYFAREYDQAIEYCNRALSIDPDFQMAHRYLEDIYRAKGMETEAMVEWAEYNNYFWKYVGMEPAARQKAREHFLTAGSKRMASEELQWVLAQKETERRPLAHRLAQLYCILGDKQQAVRWLSMSIAKPSFWLVYIGLDPSFDSLRNEPGFKEVLEKMHLSANASNPT
jgi:DNA-binding winged helix-turn-helix (wHTH) protein/TolB-like protein/Tfp pilus assembly protein PilF